MRFPWGIALGLAGAAIVAGVIMSDTPKQKPSTQTTPTGGGKAEPIHVGVRGDPELEALLQEMDDEFRSAGIRSFTAAEVTKMRKTPGPSYAIPPRSFWPRMVSTLQVVQRMRDEWGQPISVYNGYRPADYNRAVGGKPGSRHQWFEALDLLPQGNRDAFATLAARHYLASSNIGFGVYGKPGAVTGVHIDTHRKRTWESAPYYVAKAQEGIA